MIRSTDVAFRSGLLTLRGSLVLPDASSAPAALLVSGSGPLDRDSNSKRLAIDVMARIAERLAADGVASLRYDKRGVGESDGDFLSAGFHDNVTDARAGLDALRARPEVDADRVVIIGHSEGAVIASMLADDGRLAGVGLLAGPACNGRHLLQWQAQGLAATPPGPIRWPMKLLRQDLEASQAKRLRRIDRSTDDVIRIRGVRVNAKWFREFMAFEPAEALRRAAVPVLAITGSKDVQVDPDDVERMARVVPTAFTGHVVDDVTHLLRTESGPASFRTYKQQARQPLDQRVCDLVTDWISEQTAESFTTSSRVGGMVAGEP